MGCLPEGGVPQRGEVTLVGGVKDNSPALKPHFPGVHPLKIIERSLSA